MKLNFKSQFVIRQPTNLNYTNLSFEPVQPMMRRLGWSTMQPLNRFTPSEPDQLVHTRGLPRSTTFVNQFIALVWSGPRATNGPRGIF
jgi:hypothetical protein